MRNINWVFVSALGLMIPLGACRHGTEESDRSKTSVTTTHRGMGEDDRAESSQTESTRTTTDRETTTSGDEYSSSTSSRYSTEGSTDIQRIDSDEDVAKMARERETLDQDTGATSETYSETGAYSGPSSGSYSAPSGTPSTAKEKDKKDKSPMAGQPSGPLYPGGPGTQGNNPMTGSDKTHDHSAHQHGTATDTSMLGDTDATAKLTSTGAAAKMNGVVGLKKMKNGATLIVHIQDAEPGRYAVQILSDGSSCSAIDDTRGTEETTGGGMTKGSKTGLASKKILARVDVGEDRMGHAEVRVTRGQLGMKNFDDLAQRVIVIREDKKTAKTEPATDTGVMACGTIDVEQAG